MKEIGISILLLVIIIIAILLPIIPARIAYRLSPDKPISAEGVLSGITVKAGGAFGAYLVILVVLLPFLHLLAQTVSSYLKPAWTVTVPITIQDKTGNPISLRAQAFQNVEVTLAPKMNSGGNEHIQFSVVGDKKNWPHTVWVKIPPNYVGSFNLRENKYIEMDSINKTVILSEIIPLRDEAAGAFDKEYVGN